MSRFYEELAEYWPLVSPLSDYEEEATYIGTLLRGRHLLELGSGGGHVAWWLRDRFALTLVDRSEAMLAMSRRILPEAEHVVGDMRTVRLGRTFDAVLVHDAIDYMTTEEDLDRLFATIRVHLVPGGVAVLVPDDLRETFAPSTDHEGADDPSSPRGIRVLEWSWDPDPNDTQVSTVYAFVVRDANGAVTSFAETHVTGLFPEATWLDRLERAGFTAKRVLEETEDDREPRRIFVATRKPDAP